MVLREDNPVVPGNYRRKRYPIRKNIYGVVVSNYGITIEQEIAEIRARHQRLREYNRVRNMIRRARKRFARIYITTE